ncbi:MAG: hypothetical protein A3E79_08905 [Burkholderiales bacterium RIFCSPHIGHO2_12_FULL_61_11]|nr:MAG: hypothetical protein A3E79_08905 [Burkholderiales bacterium RIFCSPHIGHO2_12_FULL_61_11]
MKRTIQVTIINDIEIEFMPSLFGGMTEAKYLAEFNKGLFSVDSIDDVFKYAARMAACFGGGYEHDGLGLVDTHTSTYPRVPDVKFKVLSEEIEEEITKGGAQ